MTDIVLFTAQVCPGSLTIPLAMPPRAGESQTVNNHIYGERKIGWDISIIAYFCPGGVGGDGGGGGIQGGAGGAGEGPTLNYDIHAVKNFTMNTWYR
jgi:hypothetical protein